VKVHRTIVPTKRERGKEEAGMEWGERKIKDKFEKTQRLGAWWWVTKECHKKIKWLSEEMIEVQNAMWNVWIKNFVFELWIEKIFLLI